MTVTVTDRGLQKRDMNHSLRSAGHPLGHYSMPQTTNNGFHPGKDALPPLFCDQTSQATNTLRLAIYSHSRRAQMEWKNQQRGLNMIALIETEHQNTCDFDRISQKKYLPSFGSCLQDVVREERAVYTALGASSFSAKLPPCASALSDVVNQPHAIPSTRPYSLKHDPERSKESHSRIQTVPRIEVTTVDMVPKRTDVLDPSGENNNLERRRQLLRILRRSK